MSVRRGDRVRIPDGRVGGVIAVWTQQQDVGYGQLRAFGWARVKLDAGGSVALPVSALEVSHQADGWSHRFHFDDVTGETRSWHVACEREKGWPS